MQVARQSVVDILRIAALPELAEEAHRVLPDRVEYNRFLARFGITQDELISRRGRSPKPVAGRPGLCQQTLKVTSYQPAERNSQTEVRIEVSEHGSESENPVIPCLAHAPHRPMSNRDWDWWPNQPNLQVLHQPSPRSDPMGEDFNYHKLGKAVPAEPGPPRRRDRGR